MTTLSIITKSQWTARNKFFSSLGGTIRGKAIEVAVYNHDQMLKDNYGSFGISHDAMAGYNAVRRDYAEHIATVARRYGVKFSDKGTVKNKKWSGEHVTNAVFLAELIAEFDQEKVKAEYTVDQALKTVKSLITRMNKELTDEEITKVILSMREVATPEEQTILVKLDSDAGTQDKEDKANLDNIADASDPALEIAA